MSLHRDWRREAGIVLSLAFGEPVPTTFDDFDLRLEPSPEERGSTRVKAPDACSAGFSLNPPMPACVGSISLSADTATTPCNETGSVKC